MRFTISLLSFAVAALGLASHADAGSCSAFVVIKSYDAGKSSVEVPSLNSPPTNLYIATV